MRDAIKYFCTFYVCVLVQEDNPQTTPFLGHRSSAVRGTNASVSWRHLSLVLYLPLTQLSESPSIHSSIPQCSASIHHPSPLPSSVRLFLNVPQQHCLYFTQIAPPHPRQLNVSTLRADFCWTLNTAPLMTHLCLSFTASQQLH